jgi:hypothetical protein
VGVGEYGNGLAKRLVEGFPLENLDKIQKDIVGC